MSTFVDFDKFTPDDYCRLWEKAKSVHEIRKVDPELRADLERLLLRMSPGVASPIRVALDESHPAVVLIRSSPHKSLSALILRA